MNDRHGVLQRLGILTLPSVRVGTPCSSTEEPSLKRLRHRDVRFVGCGAACVSLSRCWYVLAAGCFVFGPDRSASRTAGWFAFLAIDPPLGHLVDDGAALTAQPLQSGHGPIDKPAQALGRGSLLVHQHAQPARTDAHVRRLGQIGAQSVRYPDIKGLLQCAGIGGDRAFQGGQIRRIGAAGPPGPGTSRTPSMPC